ncbi:MAG: acyl-CoA dehydrogenase [Subtercola sp.]|nr:acyl-CoA dehydrogenase [Subtercola sp.]
MSIEQTTARAVAWSNEHPPPIGAPGGNRTPSSAGEHDAWVQWTRDLHASGLATLHWPERWGGEDAGADDVRAVTRVLREAGMPLPLTDVALNLVAPSVMAYGTDEQKEHHLPRIGDGTAIWTQLFSEPEAGSDLASLRTRAVPDGDGWLINGQKVWNTYAHIAGWGLLLARTGEQSSRHKSLSMFLVPMDAPGIRVVPIVELTGDSDFNEVFFDDVHLGADALLGEVDGGWGVSMGTLAEERRVVGALVLGLEADARRLARVVDDLGNAITDDLVVRLAEVLCDVDALVVLAKAGFPENFESAGKILFSEINIRLTQLGIDLGAAYPQAVPAGWVRRWADSYVYSRGYTISGGANELLRGVLARRALGLPRV